MSEVFLSYARKDSDRAKILAEVLVGSGLTVWWDRVIPAGRVFDEVIEEELDAAGCAIVLWSASSVKSRWVRGEAESAVEQDKFVPVLIDRVGIPLAFRQFQAADLVGWDGKSESEAFQKLVSDIRRLLGLPQAQGTLTPADPPGSDREPSGVTGKPAAPEPLRTEEGVRPVEAKPPGRSRRWLWAGGLLLAGLALIFALRGWPVVGSGPGLTRSPVRDCLTSLTLHWPPEAHGDPLSFVDGCTVQVNGVVSKGTVDECPEASFVHWQWGDGTEGKGWFPARHQYPRDGEYSLAVEAVLVSGEVLTADSRVNVVGCQTDLPEPRDLEPERKAPPTGDASALRTACAALDGEACYMLGMMYLEGKGGLPRDRGEALEQFLRACDYGSERGCAVRADPRTLQTICDALVGEACYMLGMMYLQGKGGLPRDRGEALEQFLRACDYRSEAGCEAHRSLQ